MPTSSASNTVNNVINGVTLSLASASPSTAVTVNVNPDATQLTTAINNLVSARNTVITEINSQFNFVSDGSGGGHWKRTMPCGTFIAGWWECSHIRSAATAGS